MQPTIGATDTLILSVTCEMMKCVSCVYICENTINFKNLDAVITQGHSIIHENLPPKRF